MNRKQKTVLWIGIAVIVLMGLFPPVQRIRSYSGLYDSSPVRYKITVEYRFVMDTANGTVVLSNLLVQWFIVSIITAGLIYTLKDKKNKKPTDEQKE